MKQSVSTDNIERKVDSDTLHIISSLPKPNTLFMIGKELRYLFYTETKFNWLHKKMWKQFFNVTIKQPINFEEER